MDKPLKIALTGASGFIGRHLLEDIDSSDLELYLITRNAAKPIKNAPVGSRIIEADLVNYDTLEKAFIGIDLIINIAAEVRNNAKLIQTNITGTENLIKAAVKNKVSKIIHISSVGVVGKQYSSTSIIIDENTVCHPVNEYERTKSISEKLLQEAQKQSNFKLVILRPTNVFGEYHPFNALLHLINHVNSGKTMICTSSAIVNYIYVKDLTSFIIKLIKDEKEYGIINVGYSCKLTTFIKILTDELNKKSSVLILPQFIINLIELTGIKKFRSISNCVVYSDEKLRINYKYPFGIENGITKVVGYYREKKLIK